MIKKVFAGMLALTALAVGTANAWDPKDIEERHAAAEEAKAVLLEKDPDMQRFFDSAVGYVIIPTVSKGGIGNREAYRAMTAPTTRRAMAGVIRQARDLDAQAADHIEHALA